MPFFLTMLPLLAANDSSSPGLAPTSSPSIMSYVLTALCTLIVLLLMFVLQGERERRKNDEKNKEKNQEQMAAVNQGLTLLLEKHGEVSKDVTEHAARINALEKQGTAYDTSLALLKQAIEIHIQSSEEDRKQLHRNIDAVRDGVRDYRNPTDRRSVERD